MTMQHPERLLYSGSTYSIGVTPLASCREAVERVRRFVEEKRRPRSTALHRGYVGHWSLNDGGLWLTRLDDRAAGDGAGATRDLLPVAFPESDGAVFASWFTGELAVGVGDPVRAPYTVAYPELLVFTVERGRFSGPVLRDNHSAVAKALSAQRAFDGL